MIPYLEALSTIDGTFSIYVYFQGTTTDLNPSKLSLTNLTYYNSKNSRYTGDLIKFDL